MDLLGGLDPAQLAAVTNPTDPVCVLARAGAGKTRVLTRRIAWRHAEKTLDVRRVLAITFTTRAARELEHRLGELLGRDTGTTGTFHAVAFRMIRDHHTDRGTVAPTILENPRRLLADVIGSGHRGNPDQLLGEVTWASARGVTAEEYGTAAREAGRNPPLDPNTVAEIITKYHAEKRRRGVVDFDDLISRCVDLLHNDPAFARAQRWRYRHFFVDEYQDVNPLQQRLLEAWLSEREDLFVVGDPNQAIYGFNGADASFLTGFVDRHPTATVIELTRNHRSTPEIIQVAESVLKQTKPTDRLPADSAPTLTACPDEQAEALTIARRARDEHAPAHRWDSQAVLMRTRAQSKVISEMLTRAGIPVTDRTEQFGGDAVRVLTFHAAKGLEWPVVHVAGIEEGFLPDFHARDPVAIAEERRLFYVATSRATRRLHLTWARRRSFGNRVVDRSPSRWLSGLPTAPPKTSRVPVSTKQPEAVPPTPDPSEVLQERLLHWRSSMARAASVPDTVVIEDRVIDELVRTAPVDLDGLQRVPGLGTIKVSRYGTVLLDILHPGRIR